MSGTLTQAPKRSTSHGAAAATASSDHLIHHPRAPRGTTPNILRAAAAGIGVLAVVAALVLTGLAGQARNRISDVGNTDAPSVRATEDFVFRLQDMDAQLVNVLLVNGDQQVHVPRANSESLYDDDRRAADGDLQDATAALAGNRQALDQLHTVSDMFGQYQAQAARTMADDEREGGTVAGRAPASVISSYLAANAILFGSDGNGGLTAAANRLESQSESAIGDSASAAQSSLTVVMGLFFGVGLVLTAGLCVLQIFVHRRFRRMMNPALLTATVTALVFTIGGGVASATASTDFSTAKSDAFDSVLALGQARADSSGINADESRWLLVHDQPSQQAQFEQSYLKGAEQVAQALPIAQTAPMPLMNAPDYDRSLDRSVTAVEATPGVPLVKGDLWGTGLTTSSGFGREFQNITFDGEADKAFTAFKDYNDYVQLDSRLRTMPLSTDADLKAAIDFDTNADTVGTSDRAFTVYATALDDVIKTNQDHFDASMPAARDGIGTWTWLPYVLALLIVGLTVQGIRPRVNEYR